MRRRSGRRHGRFVAINCGGFEGSPAAAIAPTQHGFCRGGARHGQALPCGCYFSRSRRYAISASNNLTRRANHRHIFIVARIKPAPENPPRAFSIRQYAVKQDMPERAEPGRCSKPNWLTARPTPSTDGRPAKTMGKPNRNRRFRAIAQARPSHT